VTTRDTAWKTTTTTTRTKTAPTGETRTSNRRLLEQKKESIMSTTSTNSGQGASIPSFNVYGAAVKVCEAYARLRTEARREVEDLLLGHAFLRDGRNSYVDWGDWNEFDRRTSFLLLLTNTSEKMAHAWWDWAFVISTKQMSQRAREEAILSMVGKLFLLRFFEEPLPRTVTRSRKKQDTLQRQGKLKRHE
jgi:hypothetical protein